MLDDEESPGRVAVHPLADEGTPTPPVPVPFELTSLRGAMCIRLGAVVFDALGLTALAISDLEEEVGIEEWVETVLLP